MKGLLSNICLQSMTASGNQHLVGTNATTSHAAWEMFEELADDEELAKEGPRLIPEFTERILAVVNLCLTRSRFSIFAAAPEPNDRFPTSDGSKPLQSFNSCRLHVTEVREGAKS